MVSPRGFKYRTLSAARRAEILAETRAEAPDPARIRVFAYGSLMWNPCFEAADAAPAFVPNYERRFCILTTRARGTPDCPGLGLGLLPGKRGCRGIAYLLDNNCLDRALEALFEREIGTGIYRPTWLTARSQSEEFAVLAFVVDTRHPQFAGDVEFEEMVTLIARAKGSYGTCRDYLANTVAELTRLGVREPAFEMLLERVDARLPDAVSRA